MKVKKWGEKKRKLLIKKEKIDMCSFDISNMHALFAETLPWVILSLYVDLPLQMRWLREEEETDYIGGVEKSEEDLEKEKICFLSPKSKYRYRHSARYFLAAIIWSSIENIAMFSWWYHSINKDDPSYYCYPLNGSKLETRIKSDEICGINNTIYDGTSNITYINRTYIGCSVKTYATGMIEGSRTAEFSQLYSDNMFKYLSDHQSMLLNIFALMISLKFLVAIFLILFVWLDIGNNGCCKKEIEEDKDEIRPRAVSSMRRSIVVRKNQAIGRQLGHKRMNLVNEFRKESSEQLRTSFKGRSRRKQMRRSFSEGSEGNNRMRKNSRLSV